MRGNVTGKAQGALCGDSGSADLEGEPCRRPPVLGDGQSPARSRLEASRELRATRSQVRSAVEPKQEHPAAPTGDPLLQAAHHARQASVRSEATAVRFSHLCSQTEFPLILTPSESCVLCTSLSKTRGLSHPAPSPRLPVLLWLNLVSPR